jgi:hypothetical protein
MRISFTVLRLAALSIVLAAPWRAAEAAVTLTRSVFGTGGGTSTSATTTVGSTFGQTLIGLAAGSSLTIHSGFWHGASGVVAVDPVEPVVPAAPGIFRLWPNHPNPFNPFTRVAYDVPQGGGHVRIQVIDVSGSRVAVLLDEPKAPGHHEVVWNGRNAQGQPVASGTYFCEMAAPGFYESMKMTLLK